MVAIAGELKPNLLERESRQRDEENAVGFGGPVLVAFGIGAPVVL